MGIIQTLPPINIGAFAYSSKSLGPGYRSILWVRGCDRRCPGCIAPQWWGKEPAELVGGEELAQRLLVKNPSVRGITISGGEPFLQAQALVGMLRFARQHREFDSIAYSGFTLEQLQNSSMPGVSELLEELDILIDGPYHQDMPANDGYRGSLNQVIHFLGNRITSDDYFAKRNPLEVHTKNGTALMIGVPSRQQLSVFNQSVNHLIDQLQEGVQLYPTRKEVLNEC
jgi:anaerobic ribonucleoside-triphosphate reductase activating protein